MFRVCLVFGLAIAVFDLQSVLGCDRNSQKNRMCERREILRMTAFCDLTGNKDRFDQGIIRTQAIIVSSNASLVDAGELYLYHPSCRVQERLVLLEYGAAYTHDRTLENRLQQVLSEKQNAPFARARVTLIGKFEVSGEEGYGHLGGFKFRLVITLLEKVEPVAQNVRWPKE